VLGDGYEAADSVLVDEDAFLNAIQDDEGEDEEDMV
jgi:hypothetical protein